MQYLAPPRRPACPDDAVASPGRRLCLQVGALSAAGALAGLTGCATGAAAPPGPRALPHTTGLELPWGMAFLPDGRLLVTERPGRLRLVEVDGRLVSAPVAGVPEVEYRGHGGLLDIVVDRFFERNRQVYLSYTAACAGDEPPLNCLMAARATLSADATALENLQPIFRQWPPVESGENLGGRLAVSRDGMLFITLGDRREPGERVHAQDLAYHQGKVVRIRTDGSVPGDNPFVHTPGALPEIWSYGHRNPQGAMLHPDSDELWTSEHGPFGGDEINITRHGRNYGWPVITYGCEYDGCAAIGEGPTKAGMEQPLTWWGQPSIAPSNLLLYTGGRFPQWRGSLFVATLAGLALWRIELGGSPAEPQVLRREPLFAELGQRLRDVQQSPDGGLYLLTDGAPASILRIEA
ncbi:PQQ-dependent sugar dehydrogenase [Aquabacterium sp. A7-Y]|uniref:PQQ-dependent sugar dehydrogenase n=1 Tax=Aquabacterium sp. A7-Y TaxID=1349605 RepID=UPI00223D8DCA|nr:PQQ-dependent sugar dehydrogenase [Aquabacterium sp. A7-Y]MCW7536388.1 PQQ-dependent sugar dehydrogenase [Aquabacterium sp. A7-Y]